MSLADAIKKPIIPLLLETIKWPPTGPMSMVFAQLLYIDFCKPDVEIQNHWKCKQMTELHDKLGSYVPGVNLVGSKAATDVKTETDSTDKKNIVGTKTLGNIKADTNSTGKITGSRYVDHDADDKQTKEVHSKQIKGTATKVKNKPHSGKNEKPAEVNKKQSESLNARIPVGQAEKHKPNTTQNKPKSTEKATKVDEPKNSPSQMGGSKVEPQLNATKNANATKNESKEARRYSERNIDAEIQRIAIRGLTELKSKNDANKNSSTCVLF